MKKIYIVGALSLTLTSAEAAVIWYATDDGTNLTLKTSGSLNIGSTKGSGGLSVATAPYGQVGNSSFGAVFATPVLTDLIMYSYPAGLNSGTPGFSNFSTSKSTPIVTGDTFIHDGSNIRWAASLGDTPGTITPNVEMVFNGETVTSMFGAGLDAGPRLLWRHNDTGDTIHLALGTPIPEPSTSLLTGVVACGALFMRRR